MLFIDDPAPTEIYTLSLHDALPILPGETGRVVARGASAEHWMLIGKWDRGACRFSGRGSSFPEFVVLTLHAWTSSRRFSLGRVLMDFPTFSWASRKSWRLCRFSQN